MIKVLVTGANGFIGNHLVNMLLNEQFSVRALVRTPEKRNQFSGEVEIFNADLTQPHTLRNVCEGVSTVFHLAGLAHAWSEDKVGFAEKHMRVNYHGTENLLNEALKSCVEHFVYFSSVKADEDTPYGSAKRKAEELLLLKSRSYGIHVTILRPSLVYGPNWKGNLHSMMSAIDKGYFIPLPETHNRRSMVSIEDICQAALLAANNPQANGKIYFVTDGKDYSTRQLYEAMCVALGKSVPKWYLPLFMFKLLAWMGDSAGKLLHRRMPFNSDALTKLFGSAQYDSRQIQHELDFQPRYDLYALLPSIVSVYKGRE
jgi:UDP-glucose 4-epimerase